MRITTFKIEVKIVIVHTKFPRVRRNFFLVVFDHFQTSEIEILFNDANYFYLKKKIVFEIRSRSRNWRKI